MASLPRYAPGPIGAVDEGPAKESQTVSFLVRAINPALFATQPTIDAFGRLQYKVADHVNDQSPFPPLLVEVIAEDTGASSTLIPPDVKRSLPQDLYGCADGHQRCA